jgi:hypothetical protein
MPTEKKSSVITEALTQQSKVMLANRLDAEFGAVQAEARAADPDDPMTEAQAVEAREKVAEADEKFATVAAAAGVTEDDIAREVTAQRRQQLTESLGIWQANLEIHQSFLDNPDMWGGVDFSGAPLNPDEQAVHVKALTAAIAAAEAELG